MLFNSFEFALFFPIVTLLFFMLPHKYRWLLLLTASCFFYMFFKPIYILILAFTIVIDYFVGIWLEQQKEQKKKKQILVLSIIANVGILVVFKYYNFLADNFNSVFQTFNKGEPIPLLSILLPIGLSFHTFQAMSYTIEVYRGNQKAEKHFGIYALYVMFYPQLVAGPIERPQNVLHQFHEKKKYDYNNLVIGMRMMLWGFFKKIVIADRLSIIVDEVYKNHTHYNGIGFIIAIVLFAFQIYADFSGYSDIALGSAKVMGFDLMQNFKYPFRSTSVTEFWRRWHISLSTWFNDYLYTPIVLNRRNWQNWAVVFGLVCTFTLSGLWHGAGWNFIFFGMLHGVVVTYEFLTKKSRKKFFKKLNPQVSKIIGISFTFCFLSIAWIFFRASNLTEATTIFKSVFNFSSNYFNLQQVSTTGLPSTFLGLPYWKFLSTLFLVPILIFIEYTITEKKYFFINNIPIWCQNVLWYIFILIIIALGVFNTSQFIYFQF